MVLRQKYWKKETKNGTRMTQLGRMNTDFIFKNDKKNRIFIKSSNNYNST